MKIRSIELTNFRKFVGTVRVENIGDNVLQRLGRTKRVRKIDACSRRLTALSSEKAKSAAGHVKAFLPLRQNGTVPPEVKTRFRHRR